MRIRILVLPLLAALALLGLTIPASAAPHTTTSHAVTSHSVVGSMASRVKADAAFWTPQRMRTAIRNGIAAGMVTSTGPTAPAAKTTAAPPVAGSGKVLAQPVSAQRTGLRPNALPTQGLPVPSTQGLAFFYDPTLNGYYACSGGTINNPTGDMVITAAHCVYDKAWMQSWIYVPAYNNGSEPYGYFVANDLTTFTAWMTSGDRNYDVGIANVGSNLLSQQLVATTGGNGLDWDASYAVNVTIWGYPVDTTHNANENGNTPFACYGYTTYQYISRIEATCNMNEGASGGPWLEYYNVTSGLGYVDGVTSTGDPLGDIDSPYFGDDVAELYADTENG